MVLAAQRAADTTQMHTALATLCRDYWYPLYAFVRRKGHAPHDAQDLTQAFFADLLGRPITGIDPSRGKFRSYLLGALKHFLANDWDRASAKKRGGGRPALEWDALNAEARFALEPSDSMEPDALYDRRWALELMDRAMANLQAEYEQKGDTTRFAVLKISLSTSSPPPAELAAALGMSEGAAKVAVHRLRQRYREVLREEIAQTVATEAEVEAEMRHLVAVLRQA
ncbi:RNA polymerase sigma-70 factor (ECF subfamily) [Roseimicrobium gellanilyticum]|uniref:RNA polymerase sigma-70 factor (ECF subfamily) n=2 Tax=Roseimicrobium gellanilyticum TaxID=748857 RepID=A0A366H0F5_9BACT|nr:RNA polymerase sigma-70 factor (ECF subfamily) [Roseimicrobium gellanilyticum]